MENNKNIITKQGLADLKEELKRLIEVERPQVIQEIADARALGDLSENAEFDAARDRQGQIEDRIKELEDIIENSQVITAKPTKTNTVRIGSKVKYKDMESKKDETVTIVGSLEADPFGDEIKISNESPLGKTLLGSSEGDSLVVPVDKKYKIKIVKINN